jgi:hypothetical protein
MSSGAKDRTRARRESEIRLFSIEFDRQGMWNPSLSFPPHPTARAETTRPTFAPDKIKLRHQAALWSYRVESAGDQTHEYTTSRLSWNFGKAALLPDSFASILILE